MPSTIIINPVSGGWHPDEARRRIAIASGWRDAAGDVPHVVITERAGHARELARAAVARGCPLVVAWGGDGTINEVATALAFGTVPMAIVPSGSGNGLATELRVATEADQAFHDAVRARPRPIDLGEIDGRLFVNIAGIGFDAAVAAKFNESCNVRRGFATYASIAGRMLLRYRPADYTITMPDARIEAPRALIVTFANSAQFGNNARIAPNAVIDDGRLDLVVVQERSRLRTILGLPRLFNGKAEGFPGYSVRRVADAVVRATEPIMFHVDGEPVQGGRELHVRVHPGALLIAVR